MPRSLCVLFLCGVLGSRAAAQLPAGFEETSHIPSVTSPVAMAYAPDGRLFICELGGRIRIFKNGQLLATPFAQISVSTNSERGLLGIAIDPAFATNNFVYVYYTTNASSLNAPATPKNRVSRLTANGDAAAANSETILLDLIPSDAGNHNAGCIRFGLDGKLYIATGDGGSTAANSQNLGNLAGKIHRINKDGTIPGDNPFVCTAGARTEIYCYGLRNPFRFAFRPGTNVMYIADVGQNTWEEINVSQSGGNYGWPTHEGSSNASGFITPLHAINHNGSGASITGGCFINNATWPSGYQGSYYYGDYIDQYLARLIVAEDNTLVQALAFGPGARPVDFIQGLDGDLYYADIAGNTIRRVWYSGRTNGFTITTDRTTATGATTIQVNWAVPNGRPATDWIGIFKVGDPNTAARWGQSTNGAATGSVNATVPNETGTFEVRYLDTANVVQGRSTHILVTAVDPPFALTPSSTNLEAGRPLSVTWTAPPGRPANDWIGLYRVGDPNQNFIWWRYTGGATTGTFFLTAPATPGQYEFRYLVNNTYTDVVRSARITVTATAGYTLSATPSAVNPGGRVTVNWTAPAGGSATDWIGLYRVGDDNRQYISWTYTGGATSGAWTLNMPNQTGQYEFRFLLNNGYSSVATSNTVTVSVGYSLSATPSTVAPQGSVTVSWTAPSGSAAADWIGLFRVGDDNRQYISWTYTQGATSGIWTLNMPTQTGQYQFRYLLNNGYTDVRATSNTVTVQ